jgi:hypothetical protein
MTNVQKAVVENGKVTNIIEVDPSNVPDWAAGYPDAVNARMGDDWDGSVFSRFEADPIIAWRANASLSRLDFCTSLVRLNILTKDQALATIDGVWPEPMLNFLSYLDADQAFEVQMEWKAAATVQRNHPFILSLGSWLGLTTAQLDAMFGWVGA